MSEVGRSIDTWSAVPRWTEAAPKGSSSLTPYEPASRFVWRRRLRIIGRSAQAAVRRRTAAWAERPIIRRRLRHTKRDAGSYGVRELLPFGAASVQRGTADQVSILRPTSDMCLTPLGALAMCTYLSVQDAGQRQGAPPVPEVARAAGMRAMQPDAAFGYVCRRCREADRSQDLVQARV